MTNINKAQFVKAVKKSVVKKVSKKSKTVGPVEIVVITDRSGSTESIKNDIIGGFNSFIAEQQKVPGEANVTVVLFDGQYELLQDRVPLAQAVLMDNSNFQPRGSTSLHDAIGVTINRFKQLHSQGEATKAIFAIMTDGEENSSREFTGPQVKALVTEVQEKFGWEVLFLAANQDASLAGGTLGVKGASTMSFAANAAGLRGATDYMNSSTRSYRSNN